MAERKKLSLCIIVKDDELYLPACLNAVKDAADEIIVADIGSGDRTEELTEPFGAVVYRPLWEDDFSKIMNFCMDHATGDWVLFLQADETISPEQYKELRLLMLNPAAESYLFHVQEEPESVFAASPAETLRLLRNRKNYRFRCRSFPYIPDEELYSVLNSGITITRSENSSGWRTPERTRLLHTDLTEHPYDGYLRYLKGLELFNQLKYEQSAASFELALHAFSGGYLYTPHLYKCLGICFLALSRHKAAEEVLSEGAWLFPCYTDLLALRAQLYHQLGMDAEAIADLRTCLTVLNTPNAYVPQPETGISAIADMLAELQAAQNEKNRA